MDKSTERMERRNMSKRGRKNERKRKKERERIVRESGCCVPAGSGVLIRWKEVLCVGGCTKRRPIEAAEGRQSLHLTLKRRLRALPGLLSLSPTSLSFLSLSLPASFRPAPLPSSPPSLLLRVCPPR